MEKRKKITYQPPRVTKLGLVEAENIQEYDGAETDGADIHVISQVAYFQATRSVSQHILLFMKKGRDRDRCDRKGVVKRMGS